MEIVWLGEAACHDSRLVGGKAANLSRLAAGYRVPAGFCLTSAAYDSGGPSRRVADALAVAYGELGERCAASEPAVAVRSSAVDEDGAGASFAGQHESYLNVAGAAGVAAAVLRCWESARSQRVLDYRRQRGLDLDGVRMAVLVQQLVAAEAAAVAFSANPLTGSRAEVVINANWGLGESIVGGTATPDSFVVRKDDLAVVARRIGAKERMTVLSPGGTREVVVPALFRARPALDDEQVAEIARMTLSLEATMGWPVDVECAFAGGALYLLQCRPITTLDG